MSTSDDLKQAQLDVAKCLVRMLADSKTPIYRLGTPHSHLYAELDSNMERFNRAHFILERGLLTMDAGPHMLMLTSVGKTAAENPVRLLSDEDIRPRMKIRKTDITGEVQS